MPDPRIAVVVVTLAMLTGCSSLRGVTNLAPTGHSGDLAIASSSDPGVTLAGGFSEGLYSLGAGNHMTILLYDGPLDNPTQAVTIRMFWKPRAGRTPIDPTATNATINYVIFPGGDSVGIYAGAGFVFPNSGVGRATFAGSLWDANLTLADGTLTFEDLLGKAIMEGRFRARRDDAETERALRTLNIAVRNKIGYPRLVMR